MIGLWSPRARITFLTVWTVFGAILSVGMMFALWQELTGATVPATVVAVRSQTSYTVSFVTAKGTRCETPHKWDPMPTTVTVGDVFDIHYANNGSCSTIRRASENDWWVGFLLTPMMPIGGLIAVLVLRRRHAREAALSP
jgi:hypothetical protein